MRFVGWLHPREPVNTQDADFLRLMERELRRLDFGRESRISRLVVSQFQIASKITQDK